MEFTTCKGELMPQECRHYSSYVTYITSLQVRETPKNMSKNI